MRYNCAPSQDFWIIRRHPKSGEYQRDRPTRGLIPYWVKDATGGRRPINAKAETVASLPSFRDAYRSTTRDAVPVLRCGNSGCVGSPLQCIHCWGDICWAREVWAGRSVTRHWIATPDRVFAHDGGAGLSGSSNFLPAVERGWALYPPTAPVTEAPPKSKPSDAILVSSLSTPDERLNHALELSAALEASHAEIAAWKELLGPQPESLAAQADRIMTQARTVRDVAAESLRAFLAQHGISQLQLEERRPTWLASKRAAQALATTARAPEALAVAPGTYLLEVMKEDWRFIAAHAPGLIAPRVLKRALALADALLAAEARVRPRRGRPYAIMTKSAKWKGKRAVAARDAAESNLHNYLEQSGMHDRVRVARDYLMEAWKRTLAEDIQLDKAAPFLDAAGALAARVRAYLDHWARQHATKS